MGLTTTQCCAVREIHGLNVHASAWKAMKSVCESMGAQGPIYDYSEYPYKVIDTTVRIRVPGLITFTGVVGYTKGDTRKPVYGDRFATFIREKGLGTVVASDPGINRLNHPTHIVKVWVWTPDPQALSDWYLANKDLKEEPAEPVVAKEKKVRKRAVKKAVEPQANQIDLSSFQEVVKKIRKSRAKPGEVKKWDANPELPSDVY